ncbi:MAG: hypothetical protein MR631_07185 [Selenomonadales bacterium]|nr:hypothetical protein [Selenomonadales bacterium]
MMEERKLWIDRYEKLPTGNITDAMDALHMKRQVIFGLQPLAQGAKTTAGFAFTIQQRRRKTPWDGKNLARQGGLIDSKTQEGDIVVIDMDQIKNVCTGGSILALRAKMRGVRGELTNGCLRDVQEIETLQFPVWFAGGCPLKSSMDVETVSCNEPLIFNGVMIVPGDLIVMDATGVVVVPKDSIPAVWEKAAAISQREKKMVELIQSGKSLVEARLIPL